MQIVGQLIGSKRTSLFNFASHCNYFGRKNIKYAPK